MRYLFIFALLFSGALQAVESSAIRNILIPDGNSLLHNCKRAVLVDDGVELDESEARKGFICFIYLKGFVHGVETSTLASIARENPAIDSVTLNREVKAAYLYCLPDNLAPIQVVRVVVQYLDRNPASLNNSPGMLTFMALVDSFPCRN